MPFGEGPVDELSQPPAPIRREARRSVQFNSASYGTERAVGKVLKTISRNQSSSPRRWTICQAA
jgi:hypothetical protein